MQWVTIVRNDKSTVSFDLTKVADITSAGEFGVINLKGARSFRVTMDADGLVYLLASAPPDAVLTFYEADAS